MNKKIHTKELLSKIILVLLCLILFISCTFFAVKITSLNKKDSVNTTSPAQTEGITKFNSDATSSALSETNLQQYNQLNLKITEYTLEFNSNTKRAEISLVVKELKNYTKEQFDLLCSYLSVNNNYKYLTLRLENGLGLLFNSENVTAIPYGLLTSNGLISTVYGYIFKNDDGNYIYRELTVPTTAFQSTAAADTTEAQNQPTDSEITSVNDDQHDLQFVYVTDNGKKYHRENCSYLKASANKIHKSEAIDKGYEPCSRCKP